MQRIAGKISKFTKREIDYLFKHAQRAIKNSSLTILLSPRQQNFARVLIVTSRKIGNAPQRNLIRRRIKAIFYQEKLFENLYDCVVISHKDMINLPFDDLKNYLITAYHKAKDIKINENTPRQ